MAMATGDSEPCRDVMPDDASRGGAVGITKADCTSSS